MGWIRHHGIVVTGIADNEYSRESSSNIKRAHDKAVKLGLPVSNIVNSPMNSYASIFIAPDGSKEGWDTSNEFEGRRALFKEWLQGMGFVWFEYADDVDNGLLAITESSTAQEYY